MHPVSLLCSLTKANKPVKSETWRANYLRDPSFPNWIMVKVSCVGALNASCCGWGPLISEMKMGLPWVHQQRTFSKRPAGILVLLGGQYSSNPSHLHSLVSSSNEPLLFSCSAAQIFPNCTPSSSDKPCFCPCMTVLTLQEREQEQERRRAGVPDPVWWWLDGKSMWVAGQLCSSPPAQGGAPLPVKQKLQRFWEAATTTGSPEEATLLAELQPVVQEAEVVLGAMFDAATDQAQQQQQQQQQALPLPLQLP